MAPLPVSPRQLSILRHLYCQHHCAWSEEALQRLTADEASDLMRVLIGPTPAINEAFAAMLRGETTADSTWWMAAIADIIAANNNTEGNQ